VQETATYEEYRAAGHDHDTAAALVGIAAICTTRAEALEKLGPKGRDRVAKAYEEHGRKLDADPQVREERERGGRALAAMAASLAAGEPPEVAQERAKQAGGQARFDYTERADELRREAFAAHGFHTDGHAPGTPRASANGHVTVVRRAEWSGKPRATPRARRVRTTESDLDPPDEPAPAERRCHNPRCREIFSTQDRRCVYCPKCSLEAKDPAFRKRVERDLLAGVGVDLDGLGLSAGTRADPRTLCKGGCSRESYTGNPTAVCHYCGEALP
jgi:hypothetical protein